MAIVSQVDELYIARRNCRAMLKEIPDHWEVDPATFDEFMLTEPNAYPGPTDFVMHHLFGIPVKPVDGSPWCLVSRTAMSKDHALFRRRRTSELVTDPPSAQVLDEYTEGTLEIQLDIDMAAFDTAVAGIGAKLGSQPALADDTADLTQIEADIQALAAKQPAPWVENKPAPYLQPAIAQAEAQFQAAVDKITETMAVPKNLVALSDIAQSPQPPDPALLHATAIAVQQAAQQIAAALEAGTFPVPPQAHHAKVGAIAVHLQVEITKEYPPWKS